MHWLIVVRNARRREECWRLRGSAANEAWDQVVRFLPRLLGSLQPQRLGAARQPVDGIVPPPARLRCYEYQR